jgi:hypothetical protein
MQTVSLDLQTDTSARNLLNAIADEKQAQLFQDLSACGVAPRSCRFIGSLSP